MSDQPGRRIIISDLDPGGGRRPVLVTSDPVIVKAVERAVRARVGSSAAGENSPARPHLELLADGGERHDAAPGTTRDRSNAPLTLDGGVQRAKRRGADHEPGGSESDDGQ